MGFSGEEYYIQQDRFTRYISERVNPARIEHGLEAISDRASDTCFRVMCEMFEVNEREQLGGNCV